MTEALTKVLLRYLKMFQLGIVVSSLGYWRQLNKGTVNSISSANLADMGNAPTFSDNLVEVVKI